MSDEGLQNQSPGMAWCGPWVFWPLTARHDWRRAIRTSKLPADVQALILTVVVRTRLWPEEKYQVACDLVAHFEDGHCSGKTYHDLVESFGDPIQAAQLIRSSKLNGRTLMSKAQMGGAWGGVALAVGFVWLAFYYYSGRPSPSTDYMPAINSRALAAADSETAWNIYRDVWAKYEFCEGPSGHFPEIYLLTDEEGTSAWRFVRPTDGAAWDACVEKLKDSHELLEALREGGVKQTLGLVLHANPADYPPRDRAALFPRVFLDDGQLHPDIDFGSYRHADGNMQQLLDGSVAWILLPHIQTFRKAARILLVDTRLAMHEGDTERAVRNIEAIFGIARQAAEPQMVVGVLVGFAIKGIGYEAIEEMLPEHRARLTERDLARLQTAVLADSPFDLLSLSAERALFSDAVQRIYTDDGHGDGRITPLGSQLAKSLIGKDYDIEIQRELGIVDRAGRAWQAIRAPLSLIAAPSRREVVARADYYFDQFESRFENPLYLDDLHDLAAEIEQLGARYELVQQIVSFIQPVRYAAFRVRANQEAVATAIAVYRYEKRHGEFPLSLERLIDEGLLDALPVDQTVGSPLRYTRSDSEFVLYSIGMDGIDDGGAAIRVHADGTLPGEHDTLNGTRPLRAGEFVFAVHGRLKGDWILWPRNSDN